jgi:hypothetical protein
MLFLSMRDPPADQITPVVPVHPMPIIVGAPRSGTTLLRFMLDAHPEMAIPPVLALAPGFTGHGDALRTELIRAVTNYPPGASSWPDFEIPDDQYWMRLSERFDLVAEDLLADLGYEV